MCTPGAAVRYFVTHLLRHQHGCEHTPPEAYHAHAVAAALAPREIWENIFRRPLPAAYRIQLFCANRQPFALGLEPSRLYVSLWPTARGYFAEHPAEVAYAAWLFQQRYQQVLTPEYGYGLKQRRLRFTTPQQTLLDELVTVFPGVYHPWHDLSSQALIEAMAAEVKPGMRVYIVGAGCGVDVRYAARRGARVRGVDINPLAVWNTRYLVASAADAATLLPRLEDIRCASMFAALPQGETWCDRIFFNMPSTNAPSRVQADCAMRDPERRILQTFLAHSRHHLAPTGKSVFVHAEPEAVRHEAQQLSILLHEYRASNTYPIFGISGEPAPHEGTSRHTAPVSLPLAEREPRGRSRAS